MRGNFQKDTTLGTEQFPGQGPSYTVVDNTKGISAGYTITVTPQAPFRVGRNRIGDPLNGVEWYFALVITGSDSVLQCELEKIQPAYVAFVYE